MKKSFIILFFFILSNTVTAQFQCGVDSVQDYDGNWYQTVQIGEQCWLAKNLQTTHYSDGTTVSGVYTNPESNVSLYGRLYTWDAIMNGASASDNNPSGVQGICPSGWHLPSDSEWKELEMFLGMSQASVDSIGFRGADEGGKLKSTGESHWNAPNAGATNSTGFSAMPAGSYDEGEFYAAGSITDFWSATNDAIDAYLRVLSYNDMRIRRINGNTNTSFARSVRCIRDDYVNNTSMEKDKIDIYPTVTNGKVNIKLHDGTQTKNVILYNALGEKVFVETGNKICSELMYLDLSSCNAGMYYVNVKTESGSFRQKILIVK